jgi:cytidine deaminase
LTFTDNSRWEGLFEHAIAVSTHSYSPYSGHKVGAALLTTTGEVFTGCNVEIKPYSLTICAEHNAISTAIAAIGPDLRIEGIAVYSARHGRLLPCGACRQVISEFGSEAIVICKEGEGYGRYPINELLPDAHW